MEALFSPEELEELRRVDAEIDAAPLDYEDWKAVELVEALLFPERERERAKRREYSRRTYERNAEKIKQYSREYYQVHWEEIRAHKRAWYQANRERILAQQREYRRRKSGITEEARKARRATAKERKRSSDREYQRKRREAAKQGAGA